MRKRMTLKILDLDSTQVLYVERNPAYFPREGEYVWLGSDRFYVEVVTSDYSLRIVRCIVSFVSAL